MRINCEKMLFGGRGLCRSDNGIVFVEGMLPSETADCFQVAKTGGIPVFAVNKLLEKSPSRREPFCKYFGSCGGCDWQFMNYDAQVGAKKEIFDDCLRRIGKFRELPAPEIYFADESAYRIRAKFSLNKKHLGFLAKKSHEIIPIARCPLLSDNLNGFLKNKEQIFSQDSLPKEIKAIDCENEVISSLNNKTGEISSGKYRFEVRGNSFFQANKFLTPKMANWCSEQVAGCENLFDIYGGVGLFSVSCSPNARNITLVELDSQMVRAAEKNFEINGIGNAKATASSAEKFFAENKITADCIIIDPPRTGLERKTAEIIANSTDKIIYISCNPTTQARDARIFADLGFTIAKTALFDCYPNTFHIETGIVFTRGLCGRPL